MNDCSLRMTVAIYEVSSALQEQRTASTDLARHVALIARMTEENNAAVQETATAATTLSQLASQLQGMVGQSRGA